MDEINLNFDQGGFNYFDYIQQKAQKNLKRLKTEAEFSTADSFGNAYETALGSQTASDQPADKFLDFKYFTSGFEAELDPRYTFSDKKQPQREKSSHQDLSFKTPSRKNLLSEF